MPERVVVCVFALCVCVLVRACVHALRVWFVG